MALVTEIFKFEKWVKYANEMTDEKLSGTRLVQTNIKMACTNGNVTFLQSCLPEKDVSQKRNDLLVNVVKDIRGHMMQNTIFTD